jgi:NADH-quinone oxidoreductase subunit E
MKSPSSHWSADLDRDFIDKVVVRQAGRPGGLLAILQQVQNNHPRKFLPPETLEYIAAKTATPLSRIFSVATFYALFNLEPQGRDTISVCRGTACHTRGSRDLFEKVMMNFGFQSAADGEPDQLSVTTADGSTTLRTVACFGQCALAPVIEVNHAIFGHMNERALQRELEALEQREPKT